MATWAYECRSCSSKDTWLVSRQEIDALPAAVRILRVKTGSGWHCAVVDRSRPVVVEGMLLREAVASDPQDCPECAALLAPEAPTPAPVAKGPPVAPTQLQGAAISIEGHRMLVVLVGLDLVQNPGEADMLIADLRPRFPGIDIVLMGQAEDGAPCCHGDAALVKLLAGVPVDKMPWRAYAVR